ncbi:MULTISPECIES: endonuclease/exonuclease/phosphatase family protein [unclassified Rhizobium]|uniref:endonuclease/exonuclease/phosphatase family protein n=1 Tax=unclassified Rhizobium TaxID=2613769 RepID=UPI00114748DE|nr:MULTISPECIES: endonuclease/exonuclease/phosphatase family protein [unclassified Rhizobium]MDM9623279.1 endonuclease/exonuclease/phosphatase family protein [Rhizobium sp. S96]
MGSRRVTVLTYNVHSCVGADRKADPHRIADVIAATGADIVALQELDVGRQRTGGIDQANVIASLLKMEAHFHPALHVVEEKYGDAIMTALPTRLMNAGPLPSLGEQRGALWVQVELGSQRLNVLNTHLGLRSFDRAAQIEALLGDDWIRNSEFHGHPSIVCGDFNAVPSSLVYKTLGQCFRDAQLLTGKKAGKTFPSRFPMVRLDHIFVSPDLDVARCEVVNTPNSARASDHLPLLAEVLLAG